MDGATAVAWTCCRLMSMFPTLPNIAKDFNGVNHQAVCCLPYATSAQLSRRVLTGQNERDANNYPATKSLSVYRPHDRL